MNVKRGTSLEVLCERVSAHRGRTLRLRGEQMPVPGPFGYVRCGPDGDTIVYPHQASAEHRAHIILHELAHLLLEHDVDEYAAHQQEAPSGDEPGPMPAPVSPAAAAFARRWGVLRRETYDDAIEREAETGAFVLKRWVRLTGAPPSRPADRAAEHVQDGFGGGERA